MSVWTKPVEASIHGVEHRHGHQEDERLHLQALPARRGLRPAVRGVEQRGIRPGKAHRHSNIGGSARFGASRLPSHGAVASADPILFTSELEHTRAYLAVEQAQYENSLFVEYDTPHTMFRVPPLTLQPIVENAVKHGRDPYAGALHISVRTRKTDKGSEIVVENDGRGFDPADNSEGHLALNNIRQRLEIMCGGTLTIEPRDGGGTRVTVFVPLSKESKP